MAPRSLDEIARAARAQAQETARPAILAGSSPPPEQRTDLSLLETAGDIVLAPLRGIEGAVQDVYGLADTLAFDVLPDYQERILGESRTGIGGLIEGVANFGAGFVGASFVPLGWVGKLGRLAPIAEGAIKGAIADFAVFDGHEERLSNLIQSFPVLQNPISEFLASNENDSQLEGRFKNVLEGLGIGAFTELAIHGIKALRAGRAVRAAGGDAKAVQSAMDAVAPPEALDEAWRKAADSDPGVPKPDDIGSPALPEAAEATIPPPDPAPVLREPLTEENPDAILRSFDVDEEKAKALYADATHRQEEGLDPRVNPRKLTPQERLAQGLVKSGLNLSRYQGPDGGLQLLRSFEKLIEPLRTHGEISRRSLNEQEQTGLLELADMVGEGNPQRLIVSLQKDVLDIRRINDRVLAYKTAMQAQAEYASEAAAKAFGAAGGDADVVAALEALRTLHDMELGVKSLLYEQGRGLGSNRIAVRSRVDLFDRKAIDEALHSAGGHDHAVKVLKKFKALYDSAPDDFTRAARAIDHARGLAGRRTLGVLNEYWYNSLLGRPTTIAVNAMSNALATVYRPLELVAGGLLTGKSAVMQEGVADLTNLVHSAREAWEAAAGALRGKGELLDPKALVSDVHDLRSGAISAPGLGVAPDTVHGQALNWFGKLVRWPSATLQTTDQFFQQLNYRAVARTQLTKELLAKGVDKSQIGAMVAAEMDKLIYRGQAYGTAALYKRGVEEAAARGRTTKSAVHAYAEEYVRKAMDSGEFSRLSTIGEAAKRRAEEATFTAPLRPGTLPYRVQEAVIAHPYLRLAMPFVRTPVNLLVASSERTLGAMKGVAQLLSAKAFPSLAPGLEHSKNRFVQDILSGDPTRAADAAGRLAFGMSTSAFVIMKAGETTEDGLPVLTGAGPSDKEQRRILEASGWAPYSIRIGDKYVSYARLDPFATVVGTAADVINYVRYAHAEDQGLVEDVSYGFAVALASNFTNKTYLAGLANALEMLQDPQRRFSNWARTLAASFVPGSAAGIVPAVDPHMREIRGIMDAARSRWPGASDSLPPLRNMLGEPVDRAKSLGGEVASILNAFVPILYREVSDDVVNRELARLQHGFSPPKRTRGALDLTTVVGRNGQDAYDRWLELQGKVKLGGKDLRAALRQLVTSSGYKRLTPESTEDAPSPRISLIQGRIEDFRAAAWRQLLREFPELARAERARVERKTQLAQGQADAQAGPQSGGNMAQTLLQAIQPRR